MSARTTARFVVSATGTADFPRTGLPEIVLIGRSNVGKSSMINALVNQTIARTSSAPGKTRLANYYIVDDAFYFVDLPGYGYARGGDEAVREFEVLTAAYFTSDTEFRGPIVGVLHLIDARHPDLPQDAAAHNWIQQLNVPTLVVATKIDKLTRADRTGHLKLLQDTYDTIVLPAAVTSGTGIAEIWKTIRTWIGSGFSRTRERP
jgi:GTP-binding protein